MRLEKVHVICTRGGCRVLGGGVCGVKSWVWGHRPRKLSSSSILIIIEISSRLIKIKIK